VEHSSIDLEEATVVRHVVRLLRRLHALLAHRRVLVEAPGLFVYVAAQTPSNEASKPMPESIGVIVRLALLAIAVAGLLALIGDIRAINRFD
jgi:hypothetical protein